MIFRKLLNSARISCLIQLACLFNSAPISCLIQLAFLIQQSDISNSEFFMKYETVNLIQSVSPLSASLECGGGDVSPT